MTTRLPIVGSTAASVEFVHERLDGPSGLHLYIDGNQKVSGWAPRPNAFSLPEIAACPYRTPSCETACYVHGLRKHRPDIADLYEHNFTTIKTILHDPNVSRYEWAVTMARYITEHCAETGFRWHVSGDIFNETYEAWIARVVDMTDGVRHWIYTRSFPLLDKLLGLCTAGAWDEGKISINLSADRDNYWLARRFADLHGLRVCYLTSDGVVPTDLAPGDVVFPDYGLRERDLAPAVARGESTWYQSLPPEARAAVCPVDFYGKAPRRRCAPTGGCDRCLR